MTITLAASGSVGLVLPAALQANLALQVDLRGRLTVATAGSLELQAKLSAAAAAALSVQAGIKAKIAAQADVVAGLQAAATAAIAIQVTPPAVQVAAAVQFAATAAADLGVSVTGPTFAADIAAGVANIQAQLSAAIDATASLNAELGASISAAAAVAASIQGEITAQLALVADLQAQLTVALGLGPFFGNAGVRLYKYDGTVANFGSEAAAYLAGAGADGMSGAVKGLLILTDAPSSFAALTTVLGIP